MAFTPSPWLDVNSVSLVIESAETLHIAYGILVSKIVNLIGNEVQACPFVAMLVLMLFYKLLS